jgi:hypothetical protein
MYNLKIVKMVKIKTTLKHRFNTTISISNVDITFDSKGEFEASKEFIEQNKELFEKIKSTPDYGLEIIVPLSKEEKEKLEQKEKEKLEQKEKEKKEKEIAIKEAHEKYFNITGKTLPADISIEELNRLLLDAEDEQKRAKQKYSQELASKTVEELKEILKQAEIPETEWKQIKTKLELIKFITDKI